jgi:putative peptide zinc metalloprotease protein
VAYRGHSGVVLTLPGSHTTDVGTKTAAQRLRLNASAYAFYGRCDGNQTVQDVWHSLLAHASDDAPTQDELMQLLLQLVRGGWIVFEGDSGPAPDFGLPDFGLPDFGLLASPSDAAGNGHTDAAGSNPRSAQASNNNLLSWRIPLGNPDALLGRLLTRCTPHLSRWLTPTGHGVLLCLWLALVLAGAATAAVQLPMLRGFMAGWLHSPHVLVLTWVLFVAMKALHEGAHAVVLKHLGGQVPQWGITWMVFTPTPYVDASAADSLASPRQRLWVSAAGAMVELALASAALLLAAALQGGLLQGGWLQHACLVVFVLGVVSGLLVNANPLLRFDGYHALTDALELPNLAQRSHQHWRAWAQHRLGLPATQLRANTAHEQAWWWAYAPAALACRVLLSVAIVGWLGSLSFALGTAVALLLLFTMFGLPALRGVRLLWGTQAPVAQAQRARRRVAAVVACVAVVVFVVPLPNATVARGVVWLPDDAVVRAPLSAFVQQVHVVQGQMVAVGDLLFELHDPAHMAEQARLDSQALQLDVAMRDALAQDAEKFQPARAQRLASERAAVQTALQQLTARQAQQALRATVAGQVQLRSERLTGGTQPATNGGSGGALSWAGRHVPQGTVLAVVVPGPGAPAAEQQAFTVRLALDEAQASRWRDHAQDKQNTSASTAVSVWLHGQASAAPAQVVRDLTAVLHELPSAALADRFGGDTVTLPADPRGLSTQRGVVWMDVQVPLHAGVPATASAHTPSAGSRVWVRLDHGHQALGLTLLRHLKTAVLLHFNPTR